MELIYCSKDELRPAVTYVPRLEVEHTKTLFKSLSDEQVQTFFQENICHGVKGPGGELFLLDGLVPLLAAPQSLKKIPICLIEDLTAVEKEKFVKKLTKKFGLNNKDRKGHVVSYKHLPTTLQELRDDPYTSLLHFLIRGKHIKNIVDAEERRQRALRLRDGLPNFKPDSEQDLQQVKDQAVQLLGERVIETKIDDLTPTQLCLGNIEIDVKSAYLKSLSEYELQAYLTRNFFLGVIDPNKKIHLIDGHHKVQSLLNLGQKSLPITIVQDYSNLSEKEFWQKMEEKQFLYLYNCQGEKITPEQLPTSFSELRDDPYRSLAWFIRKNRVYAKDGKPFQEFQWANYLRKKLPNLELKSVKDVKKNAGAIIDVLYTDEALSLRGHLGKAAPIKEFNTSIY